MVDLIPVDHDPFAPQLVPVDHDPFGPLTPMGDPAEIPAFGRYLGNVASGKIAAEALPETYDPGKSFASNVRDPAGIEQAMGIAGGFQGAGLGIKAFHGSPHDFERFDMSKIGTGEGNQAFGRGLYFAEHEPVAGSYKPPGGHMYETEINAEPEHFLDWDKPLSEQSEHVTQAIRKVYPNLDLSSVPTDALAARGPADKLREAGIPGIRYLDQGSRGAGEGTHNYVVFDDKLIDIIKKYGLGALIAGGAATIPGAEGQAQHLIPVEHDPFAGAQP